MMLHLEEEYIVKILAAVGIAANTIEIVVSMFKKHCKAPVLIGVKNKDGLFPLVTTIWFWDGLSSDRDQEDYKTADGRDHILQFVMGKQALNELTDPVIDNLIIVADSNRSMNIMFKLIWHKSIRFLECYRYGPTLGRQESLILPPSLCALTSEGSDASVARTNIRAMVRLTQPWQRKHSGINMALIEPNRKASDDEKVKDRAAARALETPRRPTGHYPGGPPPRQFVPPSTITGYAELSELDIKPSGVNEQASVPIEVMNPNVRTAGYINSLVQPPSTRANPIAPHNGNGPMTTNMISRSSVSGSRTQPPLSTRTHSTSTSVVPTAIASIELLERERLRNETIAATEERVKEMVKIAADNAKEEAELIRLRAKEDLEADAQRIKLRVMEEFEAEVRALIDSAKEELRLYKLDLQATTSSTAENQIIVHEVVPYGTESVPLHEPISAQSQDSVQEPEELPKQGPSRASKSSAGSTRTESHKARSPKYHDRNRSDRSREPRPVDFREPNHNSRSTYRHRDHPPPSTTDRSRSRRSRSTDRSNRPYSKR